MNFSSLIGIILGIGMMYQALISTSKDLHFFLDFHGMLIVLGGTAAAASLSFPLKDVLTLIRVFIFRILGRNRIRYQDLILQILELNKRTTLGPGAMKEMIPELKHEFLKEAVTMITMGVLTETEIRSTLEQRIVTSETQLMYEANMFRTIGRFPPAFGLLATTLGMIGLLQKIGQPGSQRLIGPAMSVGLVGTLYGIALANLVFIPMAENLTEKTHEEIAMRKMIVEGILLLKSQVNPLTLRERLNSYVLPRHRVVRRMNSP